MTTLTNSTGDYYPPYEHSPNSAGEYYYQALPSRCHGCGGKGWVAVDGKPHLCPVCGGRGEKPLEDKAKITYD